MSRRRRGSSVSWYRRKAEHEALVAHYRSLGFPHYPFMLGHVRAGMTATMVEGINRALLAQTETDMKESISA